MASLDIYLLNVGQADTSIIKTPAGNVIIIDAVRPKKVKDLLNRIRPDGKIAHRIVGQRPVFQQWRTETVIRNHIRPKL